MNGSIGTICCALVGVELQCMTWVLWTEINNASFSEAEFVNQGISMELTQSNEKQKDSAN